MKQDIPGAPIPETQYTSLLFGKSSAKNSTKMKDIGPSEASVATPPPGSATVHFHLSIISSINIIALISAYTIKHLIANYRIK